MLVDATRLLNLLIESAHVVEVNGHAAFVEIPSGVLESMIEWEAHNEDREHEEDFGDSIELDSQFAA